MATNQQLIAGFYTAFFDRAPDAEGLSYWVGQLAAGQTFSDVAAGFAGHPVFEATYGELSNEEFVNQIYFNVLGAEGDAAGVQGWVAALEGGVSREQFVADFVYAALNTDLDAMLANGDLTQEEYELAVARQATLTNKADVGIYFAETLGEATRIDPAIANDPAALASDPAYQASRQVLQGVTADPATVNAAQQWVDAYEPVDPGVPGQQFVLTDGRDVVTGTADNDVFYADVGQNSHGALANALATGDRVDGGAGRDTLIASMINDNETGGGSGNTLAPRPITESVEVVAIEALENVTIDAGRMNNVEEYWSDNSRGDLTFDDVRIGTQQSVTKDITFGLRSVDVDAGLSAWFDTNSLRNEGTFQSNSSLMVRIADVTTATPDAPLSNVSLELGFRLAGQSYSLDVVSTDGTYAGMRQAIDAALTELGLARLEVTLANPYNQVTVANNVTTLPFTAQEILIVDPNGSEFTNVTFDYSSIETVAEEFLVAGTARPQDPSETNTLIETNLILDNAGRGSTAGDVVIGGMSNSNKVVEKLNLEVDRSSKIDSLGTGSGRVANASFQVIEVTSGVNDGDLVIGGVGNVYNFDATAFTGQNLAVSGLVGYGSDLRALDQDSSEFARAQDYVYNTGASNDTINLNWNGDNAAEFAGFSLSVNTGAGNDNVHLKSDFAVGANLANQQDLRNVMVSTGAGNDVVRTEGAGAVIISTGTGNDVVYTDNSGSQWLDRDANAATWVVGATNTDIVDLDGSPVALGIGGGIPAVLYGTQLRVTFSGAGTGGGVTAGGANALTNGFESIVNILPEGQVFGNRADINAAIKQAINGNDTLNKLLVASDGPNNTLVIRSKIDGSFVADDLEIEVLVAQASNANAPRYIDAAAQADIVEAIQEATRNSEYTWNAAVLADSAAAANGIQGLGVDGAVQATQGPGGVAEVVEVDFFGSAGMTGQTVVFDGVTVTLASDATNGEEVAAEFVSQYNAAAGRTWNATDNTDGTVTFESITSGDRPNVVAGDFGGTATLTLSIDSISNGSVGGAALTGTQSIANNTGNVVNLGAGNDLVVLSTEASSTEVISISGYDNGVNTIVNFTAAAGAGMDMLQLGAYLTTMEYATGSTSTVSQRLVDNGVAAGGAIEANHVTLVSFTTNPADGELFSALTATELLAALNSSSPAAGFGGLGTATTLDGFADGEYVGDVYKAVLLVQNDTNLGEYKAFELTVGQDGDTTTAEVTAVQLIGTLDFGAAVALTDANIA